jgi:mRNA-degrading endonuclease RelE of RelBE toxin-antitoxin system
VKYEIRLSRRAQRDLDRLDRATRQRIVRRLEQLAEIPLPLTCPFR